MRRADLAPMRLQGFRPMVSLDGADLSRFASWLKDARRFVCDEGPSRFSLLGFARANAEDPSLPEYLAALEALDVGELAQLHFQDQWIRRVV